MIRSLATEIEMDRLYRMPLDEYHRLIEAGGFEGMRLELIDGLIVEMSPKSREHDQAIAWLTHWLARNLDHDRFRFGSGLALTPRAIRARACWSPRSPSCLRLTSASCSLPRMAS